jgi:hypothetical protein
MAKRKPNKGPSRFTVLCALITVGSLGYVMLAFSQTKTGTIIFHLLSATAAPSKLKVRALLARGCFCQTASVPIFRS